DSFVHTYRSELASAQVNGQTYAYDYDNIGNRRMSIDASDYAFYDANELNQYSSIRKNEESAFVPTFDAAGNQTLVRTATGTWSVTYNAENRPVIFQKTTDSVTTRITCTYDYMGRRATKKVEEITTDAEGNETTAIISNHRFIYRGYLQIGCCDLSRANHPCLWLITWDPTQPVATRPLAIQKDGTWYTYGWDLTKNICEIFGQNGYIRSTYAYTPFGAVTANGDITQPIQWSSEHYDSELALVYYNYRHYNPTDGRWINRDPIAEQGGWNLYGFVGNKSYENDELGLIKRHTPITEFVIKRNHIKWLHIIFGQITKKESEEDTYGHWWIEFGNESYGWWPVGQVTLWDTLTSTAGQLNGLVNPHPTKDDHHGDKADYEFHPYLYVGNIFSTFMQYGKKKGKKCTCVEVEDIKNCIRSFAKSYTGTWSYPWGQNCHSFQEEMMNMCCMREARY
ncbi:MAG: RHS repeat-associated core domain-containing protein, partial [Akkermansia sp.]|nr:RHS repeat-associated core domain-containing protein [Akkermansia sp.]